MNTGQDQLEADQRTAKNRYLIAAVLAACAALAGLVGLLISGRATILGLLSIVAAVLLLAYAIRQRARSEEYEQRLRGKDAG